MKYYILEAGSYSVSIRSNSHTVLDERTFELGSDVDYSKDGRPSDGIPAVNRFDYADAGRSYLSRKDGFANYDDVTAPPTEFEIDKDTEKAIQQISVAKYNPSKYDSDEDVMPTLGADNGLKLADQIGRAHV